MDFIPLCEKFKRELGEIETSSSSILERARMAINLSHNLLQLLKSHIVRNGFENKIAEIHFFKNIKQVRIHPGNYVFYDMTCLFTFGGINYMYYDKKGECFVDA